MSHRWVLLLAGLLALITAGGVAQAGERLGKGEMVRLLTGTTMKAHFIKESSEQEGFTSRVNLRFRFRSNGRAEKTTQRAASRLGDFTEQGSWSVNKDGKLCLSWEPANKKRCRFVEARPDGTWRLLGGKYEIAVDAIETNH